MARTRTFIGVAVGEDTRERAEQLQARLAATGAAVKWVDPDNLHVTLLFLGELDDRELVDVCRAATAAARTAPPFALTVAGVGAFPTPRRPRTIWGGVTAGADELVRLHAAIEAPLFERGTYRREERAYTPHLTLGRVTGEADGELLAAELPTLMSWAGGETAVGEVLVFASDFGGGRGGKHRGPAYSVIGRAALTGRAGG